MSTIDPKNKWPVQAENAVKASHAMATRATKPNLTHGHSPAATHGKAEKDGFKGSHELEEASADPKADIKSLVDAFGPGQAPPTEELERALKQGKTGEMLVGEKKQDQSIADHVCGQSCGCVKTKGGGTDPLKTLQDRDDEVRKHENDHLAEAGEFAASGPLLDLTEAASNGKSYVTSGKVMVNVGEVSGDPVKTIQKMKKIEKSSLKPAEPSDQDLRVAADAGIKRQKAEVELAEKRRKAEEDKRHGIAPTEVLPPIGAET